MKFSLDQFPILCLLFTLRTVSGSEDEVISLIEIEARKLPASNYYNDPYRFVQKFDSSSKITEYYESIGSELGKRVFTRNSNDEGQGIVVLRQGEDRLRPAAYKGTYVVLIMNKAKKKIYHPVFAYYRPKKPIEWDVWGPERFQGSSPFLLGWTSCLSSIYTPCKAGADKTTDVSRRDIPDISPNQIPNEQQIDDSKIDFFVDLRDTQDEAKLVGRTVSLQLNQMEGKAGVQGEARGRGVYYPPPPPYPYPGQLVPVVPVRVVPIYGQPYPPPYYPPPYPPQYPPPYPGDHRQGDININVYDKRKGGKDKDRNRKNGGDSAKTSNSNSVDVYMGGGNDGSGSVSATRKSGSGGGSRGDGNNDEDSESGSGNDEDAKRSGNVGGASGGNSKSGASKNSKDSKNSKSGGSSKNSIKTNTKSTKSDVDNRKLSSSDAKNGNSDAGDDGDNNDERLAGGSNDEDERSNDKNDKSKFGGKGGKSGNSGSGSSKGSHRNHGNGPINYITNIINVVGGQPAPPPPPPPQQNNLTVSLSISDTDTDVIEVVDEKPKSKSQKTNIEAQDLKADLEGNADEEVVSDGSAVASNIASRAKVKASSNAGAVMEDEYVVDDTPNAGGAAASFSGLDSDANRKSDFSKKSWVGADGTEYTESEWSSSSNSKSSAKAGTLATNVKTGSKTKSGKGRSLLGIGTAETFDPTQKSEVDLFSRPGWNTQNFKPNELKNFKVEAGDAHYTGYGNCADEQVDLTKLEINSPQNVTEQIRTFLAQLKSQCKKQILDLLVKMSSHGGSLLKEKLSASSKHEFFKISSLWKILIKPKLTLEEAQELNIATEFFIFTKTLLGQIVDAKQSHFSTVKDLINTDFPTTVSEIPKSPNVVSQLAISIFTLDLILSSVPAHTILLSRYLILTLKTNFVKILQDFDRLKNCSDCDSKQATIFNNDLIGLLAFQEFIAICIGSDEPRGPADLLAKFNSYLNENLKHLNERVVLYTS